ncbi:MAG: histidine kinase [Stomatobaculum sp.]|nr:histidine kinase [Stomatobaculum sp.]
MGQSYDFRPWRTNLLIGAVTALSSQLYLFVFINNFRISPSVILLPVLLMTVGRQLSTIGICSITALIVFLFRILLLEVDGSMPEQTILQVIPGALYYVFYGVLFRIQIPRKRTASYTQAVIASFYCDFGANLTEIAFRNLTLGGEVPTLNQLGLLILVAVMRSLLAAVLFNMLENYRAMQVRDIQEQRYQSMFMVITSLKSELYLMRKNTEEIEQVMGNAYRLHELAEQRQVPEEVRQMTLGIARDVHEIKKGYIRIMDGLESTINAENEEERMTFREILEILEGIAKTRVRKLELDISFLFDCRDNFVTTDHYALMTILRNLVSNAIEAIEGDRRSGEITVRERLRTAEQAKEGEKSCFVLEVEDNGPGISEKQLKKIFRMGYSTKFDGKTGNIYRGVGLAGVKQTVEDYFGGCIEVESEPGERTCFRILIPEEKLKLPET